MYRYIEWKIKQDENLSTNLVGIGLQIPYQEKINEVVDVLGKYLPITYYQRIQNISIVQLLYFTSVYHDFTQILQ